MATEQRFFETKQIDLTTANKVYEVKDLRGGEIITIKALRTNTGVVYIGTENVKSSDGFILDKGESIEIKYEPDIPTKYFLRIWALAATAGDDVCYIFVPFSAVVEKIEE